MLDALARDMDLSQVVAVDRRWPSAKKGPLEARGVTVREIDIVENRAQALELLWGADLLVNLAGPFYKLGTAALSLAIEAAVNYLDICDDVDATADLLRLDGSAKQAGITALIGMGSTPGTSNVLVRAAYDALLRQGQAESGIQVDIAWTVDQRDMSPGVAAHMLHGFVTALEMAPDPRRAPAWSDLSPSVQAFPDPVGDNLVLTIAHPEPVTIPRFLPGTTVANKGTVAPNHHVHYLWSLARIADSLPIDQGAAAYDEYLKAALVSNPAVQGSGLSIEVRGADAGFRFASGSHLSMETATGTPAAAGVLYMLAADDLPDGVIAPECLRPAEFFSQLRRVSAGGGGLETFAVRADGTVERVSLKTLLQ